MAANDSSPALPPPINPIRRHRKRVSFSRLSSDTSSPLPPYKPSLLVSDPSEQPPDYPDSAEEADQESETDDQITHLLSPPLSPRHRRRKLFKSGSQQRTRRANFYDNHPSTQSDIFLDRILERSVAALELSNTLLQSSMSTQSSLNNVLSPEQPLPDESLDSRARLLNERIRGNNHARWMDDLDVLAEDVESLFGFDGQRTSNAGGVDIPGRLKVPGKSPEQMVSRSLPPSGTVRKPHHAAADARGRGHSDCGRLRLTTDQHVFSASAPRAMTQYVNVDAEFGGTHEGSSDASRSILLPSTLGLHSSSTLSSFSSPVSSTLSPSANGSSPAYASLARQASRSPRSSRSPSASGSSSRTYRQRSSSRSSNQPPSPHLLPRIIPPPIEELPSQSDSSSSESPHPLRTVESLRRILEEQAMQSSNSAVLKHKESESKLALHPAPAFLPRSPPVEPVLSTSTTTTSISRLYSKGSHSTSTRPRSPPLHSSLKRPPPLETAPSSSITGISSMRSPLPAQSSATSSGRSTPRSVAFGPLPEPIRPEGAPSRFKEQREAKAKGKARSRSGLRASGKDGKGKGGDKEKEDSSWWTTWLTGGSVLSMSASRAEDRMEDRIMRSWGRPGFEDWPV